MDSTAMVLPTSQDVNRQTNVTSKGREHPLLTVQSEQDQLEANLKLMACRLSGHPSRIEEFYNQLRSSNSTPGEEELRNNIEHIGGNGKLLLVNNLSFLFVHL